MKNWSNKQLAIFERVEDPNGGSLIIEAVAGSGKTTTIVEAVKRCLGTTIFLAFNKSISTELAARGVNARTFHSLCFNPVLKFKKARAAEPNKLRRLVDGNMNGDNAFLYGAFITRLVSLAKQSGVGCLIEDSEQIWLDIIEHHDLELDSEKANITDAVDFARKLLQWSNASDMVDFDDMLYLCVKEGLPLPKFQYVFVDEAQDTNAIQRAILRKLMLPHSRLIAVGDPAQAIYGFRGADSESLNMIAEEFGASRLPLSVSYRCAKNVVGFAQQYVSHIEASETAPDGEVINLDTKWQVSEFASSDMVVCRTTKPLISLGYKMLKARVPVRIMGREIGQGLIALIDKMNANGIDRLLEKLDAWRTREVEKFVAKRQEAKAASIEDKADAILCLIEGLAETERTVPALKEVIRTLFSDAAGCTTLATIHKAKGLEADRVFWLNSSKCPAVWASRPWQQQQERNLCYVAVTRAKTTLVLIEEPKKDR
jgi:DNA helicase II / ATP-dependent DNA helicase PcrA